MTLANSKYKVLLYFICLAGIAISMYCYSLFKTIQEHDNSLRASIIETQKLEYTNSKLLFNYLESIKSKPKTMNRISTEKYSDAIGVISKDERLVFRFASWHCNMCYEEELKRLNNLNSKVDIIILTTFEDKHFRALRGKYKQVFPRGIYINTRSNLGLPQENIGEPYYFILSEDSTVSSIFIPDKLLPDLTDNYFSIIGEIFSEN